MRILAVVPARAGSRRLPGKNIRPLGGKPLILWSIEVGRRMRDVCDVLVSTDDAAIAGVARAAGALVPWLRPTELASDTASAVDVTLHAVDWYEATNGQVDGVLLLQPTSPFRTRATAERGIELFRKLDRRSVASVSTARSHPMWCFHVEGDTMRPFFDTAALDRRSQDLPNAYVMNGALYLISPENLRRTRSFVAEGVSPLIIDSEIEAIDIDTEYDWMIAEAALLARGDARSDDHMPGNPGRSVV